MASIKSESHKPNKSKHTRRIGNKDLQANTRNVLTLDWPINTRIGLANAVILLILKGSSAQPKNTSAKHATSLATTQAYAFKNAQQKQSNYKHRKPTAHQLKASNIHVQDSNEEADSSDDSFCLQLKIQCAQATTQEDPKNQHAWSQT